ASADRPRLKSGPGASTLGGAIRGAPKLNGEKYSGGALFLASPTVVVVLVAAAASVCACLFVRRLGGTLLAALTVGGGLWRLTPNCNCATEVVGDRVADAKGRVAARVVELTGTGGMPAAIVNVDTIDELGSRASTFGSSA